MQMVDLPSDGEGLSWIASHDPAGLQLIPGLQPACIEAAAAGDLEALAYLRFTAQHHAAYPGICAQDDFDRAIMQISEDSDDHASYRLLDDLEKRDAHFKDLFQDRHQHTLKQYAQALHEGQLGALMWLRAICLKTWTIQELDPVDTAAAAGQLDILKFLRSGPCPLFWDEETAAAALPHLECLKWLLSTDAPEGPCPYENNILSQIAGQHDLPALQWFYAHSGLVDEDTWNVEILETAARHGDQPMAEWLRAQDPPAPWDESVCRAAAREGKIGMLHWLRSQRPPCPWDESVTAAAAWSNIKTLQWLRAQVPPCPWGQSACTEAALSGHLEVLIWLRSQDPPCPWDQQKCTEAAAGQPNVEMMRWLCDGHDVADPSTMLECTHKAARTGNLAMLEWLCHHGVPLTGSLYAVAADHNHNHILRFLHSRKVAPPTHPIGGIMTLYIKMTVWMFLCDIGAHMSDATRQRVMQIRRACCLFHGLVRWCRRAVSDPSRNAHLAFDSLAKDRSGQLLLTRLSRLPPDLISKIAVAAELQHDIFDGSSTSA